MGRWLQSERFGIDAGCRQLLDWGCRLDLQATSPQVLRVGTLLCTVVAFMNFCCLPPSATNGRWLLRMAAGIQIVGLILAASWQFARSLAPLRADGVAELVAITGIRSTPLLLALIGAPSLSVLSVWLIPLPLWGLAYTSGGVAIEQLAALCVWSIVIYLFLAAIAAGNATAYRMSVFMQEHPNYSITLAVLGQFVMYHLILIFAGYAAGYLNAQVSSGGIFFAVTVGNFLPISGAVFAGLWDGPRCRLSRARGRAAIISQFRCSRHRLVYGSSQLARTNVFTAKTSRSRRRFLADTVRMDREFSPAATVG